MNYKPEHISFSSLSLYDNCPRCYMLKYVFGCRQKDTDALLFGTCYHEGLASHYLENDFWLGFNKSLRENKVIGPIAHKYKSSAQIMYDHFRAFGDRYKPSKVEYGFLTPLLNPLNGKSLSIPIKGRIDLITEDEFIVDEKTSTDDYGEEKINDPQLLIYSMVYRKLFGKPPKKLIFSVHIKNTKVGRWMKVERTPDEIDEAIQWKKMSKSLDGILRGDFEPRQVNIRWFRHFAMCPEFIKPRRKNY